MLTDQLKEKGAKLTLSKQEHDFFAIAYPNYDDHRPEFLPIWTSNGKIEIPDFPFYVEILEVLSFIFEYIKIFSIAIICIYFTHFVFISEYGNLSTDSKGTLAFIFVVYVVLLYHFLGPKAYYLFFMHKNDGEYYFYTLIHWGKLSRDIVYHGKSIMIRQSTLRALKHKAYYLSKYLDLNEYEIRLMRENAKQLYNIEEYLRRSGKIFERKK